MTGNSRGGLLRPRNVLGAAIIAGIGLGIYLGPLFKGWGLGGGNTIGVTGQESSSAANRGKESDADSSTHAMKSSDSPDSAEESLPAKVPDVVKVLIDERSYYLRQSGGDTPIHLPQLMKLVKQAPGDPDGFKIRIYEKATARASAEEALKEALANAEIPETAVLWVPNPVK